jgi:hypothetical protein
MSTRVVCMYVYVRVHSYIHTYIHIYIHIYTWIQTAKFVDVPYGRVYKWLITQMFCMHVLQVLKNISNYICFLISGFHACMHIYIHIHIIYTHMHACERMTQIPSYIWRLRQACVQPASRARKNESQMDSPRPSATALCASFLSKCTTSCPSRRRARLAVLPQQLPPCDSSRSPDPSCSILAPWLLAP